MDITFYDRSGRPVAYSEDKVHIFLFSGHAVGFIHDKSLYDYSGKHLGWLNNGWVREHSGRCVLFTEKSRGGPEKPIKSIKPRKNVKQVKPPKGVRQERRSRPTASKSWSALTGEQFFAWYRSN